MERDDGINEAAVPEGSFSGVVAPTGPTEPPKLSEAAKQAWKAAQDIGEKTVQEIRHTIKTTGGLPRWGPEGMNPDDGFENEDANGRFEEEEEGAGGRRLYQMNRYFASGPYGGILESIAEAIGNTPLVRMSRLARLYGLECDLLGKCEYLSAGGSVKDRIGKAMVEKAEREGRIKPGDTLIEPTSGNTGIGIALAAAVHGYKMIVTMPAKMSKEKSDMMKRLGAEIVRTPTEAAWNDEDSHMSVAARLQRELPNAHILDQYNNPANPDVHYDITAEEILTQCDGDLDMIVVGVGTGGTITGVARKIREKCPKCMVIGVDPKGSILAVPDSLNDERRLQSYLVEGIGYDFIPGVLDRRVVDEWIKVGDPESFATARALIRHEGLLVGGSSGANVWGALQAAKRLRKGQKCVVLLPDSSRNYMSKFISDDWMVENGFPVEDKEKVKEREQQYGDARVRDLIEMTEPRDDLPLVTAEDTVENVIHLMHEKRAKEVIVNDASAENGEVKPVGLLSEEHVEHSLQSGRCTMQSPVRQIAFKKISKASPSTRLVDVVKIFDFSPFVCVLEETPTEPGPHNGEAANMNGGGIKDHDDRPLLGVITKIDLLKWLAVKQRSA
ncbi:cystathionine beta-synthase [Cystoisospora suis]|uniref:Cystathionine beta-synthase n=1 Tax=Cystoisospora suis TaxID=483139 RepID=A0A2C6LGA9_9APIC|nr:cystathionine beta-synthase [Cystoisospora suis]